MTTSEMIAVLQAAEAGKTIECRPVGANNWTTISGSIWDFARNDYRVRPEPRRWWLLLTRYGSVPRLFPTEGKAVEYAGNNPSLLERDLEMVEVVEVKATKSLEAVR